MDPDKYEALLILAGLASYTRFGFQIKAGAWRKFLIVPSSCCGLRLKLGKIFT